MKRYVVKGIAASIHEGAEVELSKEQAHDRRHFVQPLGGERYRVIQPFDLKRGEQFGFGGDFPKAMAEVVDSVPSGSSQREDAADEAAPPAPSSDPRKARPRR